MQLYSYWNGQNGSPDYLILVLLYYSNVCTLPSLSVPLLHVDVSLSKHSDQKVGFHTLDQTVCQLSASVNPFDLISCWVILFGCLLGIDPQGLSQRGKPNSQALVLHLAPNLARQVVTQGGQSVKYRCNIARWLCSYHSLTDFKWPVNSQSKARIACLQTQLIPAASVPTSIARS